MKNLQSTYTNAELSGNQTLLDIDALKNIAYKMEVGKTEKYHKGFFDRMMNKIGWYRKSEWYILDASKFMRYPFLSGKYVQGE
jgi:hypothetical protein